MYTIYPFLKSGRIGVNSTDESLYIGNSKGEPVQLVTEANSAEIIKTVIEEVSGGSTIIGVANEIPRKEALVVGNVVQFSGHNWIVAHTTETEAYLTLTDTCAAYYFGPFNNNQQSCYCFAGREIGSAEKRWLKTITAGNTTGKVFIATKDQLNGGFAYFNSNARRAASSSYLTSQRNPNNDEDGNPQAYLINSNGAIYDFAGLSDSKYDFRPSLCIDLTAYENGPAEIPYDLPPLGQIVLGNTITWANHNWIVVTTPTESICYLTLAELDGLSTWNELNNTCTVWSSANFTEAQLASLTSVTAGNTSGKVFVATAEQMDGNFSYFNSDERRKMDQSYWTSTDYGIVVKRPEYVDATGAIAHDDNDATGSMGFRPSIALNMWLYNWI